ncbi:MAG: M24 family metallopeptidase, partial [Oscillospiraceae bacterium]|nr:M24 family metallopeptidase [Oscillospiraceae bacterium]
TRTVCVGSITDKQELVYETVLKAHNEVKKQAHAGMAGKELDFVARDIINKAGFEGKFGHSLGHSLGLFIHEKPMASPTYEGILPAGSIVTDEPGIYLEGEFGVRIENMILLREDGCEDLTKSPTELIRL